MSTPKSFDESVLAEWGKLDPEGYNQIVLNLLELFFQMHQKNETELTAALASLDTDRLIAVVHKMKSNFGNIGAIAAHSVLSEAEGQLRSKNLDAALLTLNEAKPIMSMAISEISRFRLSLRSA